MKAEDIQFLLLFALLVVLFLVGARLIPKEEVPDHEELEAEHD